ncbi:MAG: hypothetical protein AAFZ15_18040 [Bacteroidota bacterium]
MKNLFLFLLVLFFTVGIVFPSCQNDDDGINCKCPPITGEFFRINDLDIINRNLNGNEIATNEIVSLDDYIIGIQIDPEFYALQKRKINTGFSLMNSALACSCIFDGMSGAKERIEEMTIVTKNDFSDNLLANDTISSLFEIRDDYYGGQFSIDSFIDREQNLLYFDGLYLLLKNKPTTDTAFQIELKIKLDNGEEFIVENEPVIIE